MFLPFHGIHEAFHLHNRTVQIPALQNQSSLHHNIRTGVVDHVAIYIGNGKIIHANNGVEVSNVNYRTVYKYARVIKD